MMRQPAMCLLMTLCAAFAIGLVACSQEPSSTPPTIEEPPGSSLPGYGGNEIGFRNGISEEGSNGSDAVGNRGAASGEWDTDGAPNDESHETEEPPEPEVPEEPIETNGENPFYATSDMPTNTFSIDVDTAGYTLVRQQLENGALPEPSSVRIEEMINYFDYNYEAPTGDDPFTVFTEMADCPWNPERKLVMIGMRGQQVEMDEQPPANLVFLLDVSGSMAQELWLIKPAFRMLANQLRPEDTISIVTYAGNDAVVIDGATGDDRDMILTSLDSLRSGGSTNGAGGIQRAYELAEEHFVAGGNNRVILATDGDFNVGISSEEGLVELIEEKAETGVFLTVYGFNVYGGGNYQDSRMEQLANHGNGTYFFIDGEAEARRAFTHSLSGTLLTIAKDVKLQIQFNPELVRGYRLIGYDNRVLANEDFNNDDVDAGELGNGEDVTAFYEVILADSDETIPPTDVTTDPNGSDETEYEDLDEGTFMAVRLRFKLPDSDTSTLVTHPIGSLHEGETPSPKFVFASIIVQLGLVLRESVYIDDRDISELDDRLRDTFVHTTSPAIAELLGLLGHAEAVGL